jgi:hypothetical protein
VADSEGDLALEVSILTFLISFSQEMSENIIKKKRRYLFPGGSIDYFTAKIRIPFELALRLLFFQSFKVLLSHVKNENFSYIYKGVEIETLELEFQVSLRLLFG